MYHSTSQLALLAILYHPSDFEQLKVCPKNERLVYYGKCISGINYIVNF